MQTQNSEKVGLLILVLGAICFFLLYKYLNLSGGKIDYKDIFSLSESLLISLFIPVILYFGLYFTSGKEVARRIGGGLGILVILAHIIGFFLHD